MLIAVLRNLGYCVIYYNFRHTFVRMRTDRDTVSRSRSEYMYRGRQQQQQQQQRFHGKRVDRMPVFTASPASVDSLFTPCTVYSEASEGGAGRTGRHLLGAANGRKLLLKIHVKIQVVISYVFACNKDKALHAARTYPQYPGL